MRSNERDRQAVREYFESQSHGDPVLHVEKAASERVGSMAYDIWDLTAESGRWWIVTNPTNLYRQEDFKSRDVVLTFHIGLATRVATQRSVPITREAAGFLPGAWRRWEQAVDALGPAREAEDFQALGMRLRECLVSMAGEFAADHLVPEGKDRPKAADVKAWVELLADHVAGGPRSEKLRSYLKKTSAETWQYVNWLTHAKNAGHWDAEIGLAITSHLLEVVTATTMRWGQSGRPERCEDCESYEVIAGECRTCGWLDLNYEPPEPPPTPSKEELAARLAEPCVTTADISTFISPNDYR
jgi:hypothetical protein